MMCSRQTSICWVWLQWMSERLYLELQSKAQTTLNLYRSCPRICYLVIWIQLITSIALISPSDHIRLSLKQSSPNIIGSLNFKHPPSPSSPLNSSQLPTSLCSRLHPLLFDPTNKDTMEICCSSSPTSLRFQLLRERLDLQEFADLRQFSSVLLIDI
jgi:hypothetical protein